MKHEEFEREAMRKLLGGDDEVLRDLLSQYEHARVASREFTGRGFFTEFEVDESLRHFSVNGRVDDVKAVFPDSEVYLFILYVTDGRIDTLEGFATMNGWEENYDDGKIEYAFDTKREYELTA